MFRRDPQTRDEWSPGQAVGCVKRQEKILEEAKGTANYNPELTYGVYQITKELNTFKEVGSGRTKTKVYEIIASA